MEFISQAVKQRYLIAPEEANAENTKNTFPLVNPNTEATICHVKCNTADEMEPIIIKAKEAQKKWGRTECAQRAALLTRISEWIKENLTRLATIESINSGKPFKDSEADMNSAAGCFAFYAKLASELPNHLSEPSTYPNPAISTYLVHKPIGVIMAIVPWNYPLVMATWKIAPALASGCAIVIKPSEFTPLTLLELFQFAEGILPPNVFNVVLGTGEAIGKPLCESKNIDKLMFTGSIPTAQRIRSHTIQNMVDCNFELGGKSPALIFSDLHSSDSSKLSNLNQIVEWCLIGCFYNNGQVCSAISRLIVQNGVFEQFKNRLVELAKLIPVLESTNPTQGCIGPLVNKAQLNRVKSYIDGAVAEGATVLCGGNVVPKNGKGYFIEPTILLVEPHMKVWQEEVFGPVLCITKFDTMDNAIHLANDTIYGLAAAVFSDDATILAECQEQLRTGLLWNNCTEQYWFSLPWKGVKMSGSGTGELGGMSCFLKTYFHSLSRMDNLDIKAQPGYFSTIKSAL